LLSFGATLDFREGANALFVRETADSCDNLDQTRLRFIAFSAHGRFLPDRAGASAFPRLHRIALWPVLVPPKRK
jgi:hypothetical protein